MSAIPQVVTALAGNEHSAGAVAPWSRSRRLLAGASVLLMLSGAVAVAAQGGGLKTRVMRLFLPEYGLTVPVVRIISQPVDNERDVRVNAALSFTIRVRNGQLDSKTMSTAKVLLAKSDGGAALPLILKPAGENQLIVRPVAALEPDTVYSVSISGLKTVIGASIAPSVTHFTTGRTPDPSIRFQKLSLVNTSGNGITALAIGPDRHLYAGTDEGVILRYPILSDGRLGAVRTITSLQTASGGKRLLIGFCFDPNATEANPTLWVSHGYHAFADAPDFTGKITRMQGPNLEDVQDIVVHLPRSARDHLNNQPSFGPDGALYWPQGSNSSYGAPDPIWENRCEHLLNAAILRLDVARLTPGRPLDALTVDAGGSYDPRSTNAPLTVHAIGIRNAYDLVWTSRGQLYTAVNGASAPGNTPAGRGAPALVGITQDEDDWLFHVKPGKYYGHPNPQWNHFVLNGGNPTDGNERSEISQYPVGTKPDPDWQPAVYDFGPHVSANGTIEYRSDAFGGKLRNALIVCRFNAGSDLISIKLKDDGTVDYTLTGIPGFTNLNAPLDLCEDRTNGNIYVTEYGARCVTLLRPLTASSPATAPRAR